MKKFIKIFFTFCIVFLSLMGKGQKIEIKSLPSGPYVTGASICVPIKMTEAFPYGTSLDLILFDNSTGNETVIGRYSGFFTPFINGTIPNGLNDNGNYKIKVRANIPPSTAVNSTNVVSISFRNSTANTISALTATNSTGFINYLYKEPLDNWGSVGLDTTIGTERSSHPPLNPTITDLGNKRLQLSITPSFNSSSCTNTLSVLDTSFISSSITNPTAGFNQSIDIGSWNILKYTSTATFDGTVKLIVPDAPPKKLTPLTFIKPAVCDAPFHTIL